MKKIKFLMFLLIGALMFQSCNNDDESNSQADLIGIWSVSDVDVTLTVNELDIIEYLTTEAGYTSQEATLLETFYATFIEASFSTLTIEFKADNTYESKIPNEDPETGTWVLNSNNTILTIDAGTADETAYAINNLSSNALSVSSQIEEEDDLNEDSVNEIILAEITLNLSK